MSGIRKLQIPCEKGHYESDGNGISERLERSVLQHELKFAREILDSAWDETEDEMGIAGARIMGTSEDLPICVPCGSISKAMLHRMFESYVKVYGHEHE